jgi:glycosyltransferase involved in cell wall biosynthesis
MRVGLYTIAGEATVGGGFVLRNDVARAVLEVHGRHEFELVSASDVRRPKRGLAYRAMRKLERLSPVELRSASSRWRLLEEHVRELVRELRLDMLWFNHLEPIDVGLPYMLNIFDLQHRMQPWFPEVSAHGQWDQREKVWAGAIRRASIITVGSEQAKEELSFLYSVPRERIHAVPFPTPQGAIEAQMVVDGDGSQTRKKYGIAGDYLLYPAQFWAHKNHVNLLHALHLLRDRSGIQLSLVLTGSDRGNLNHVRDVASRLGLGNHVHFLGFIPHADVIALYRQAFALAYVSFFGPENLPPLEAMAMGCPVVLADVPGVRTLFGDAPILVDPRDEGSIAEGIRQLVQKPEVRQRHIAIGREIAIQNTAARYVGQIEEILDAFEPVRRCWR